MLRSRHFFTLLLFALLLHPAHAALILRCDLESLCYLSTDVVEAQLVDSHNQVQRYQQARNPGGLSVEADPKAPTLAAECAAIAAKWTVLEGLKPLLDHSPRREDIPALRALVRQRRFAERSNIVKATALSRLASLHTNAEQSFRIERG